MNKIKKEIISNKKRSILLIMTIIFIFLVILLLSAGVVFYNEFLDVKARLVNIENSIALNVTKIEENKDNIDKSFDASSKIKANTGNIESLFNEINNHNFINYIEVLQSSVFFIDEAYFVNDDTIYILLEQQSFINDDNILAYNSSTHWEKSIIDLNGSIKEAFEICCNDINEWNDVKITYTYSYIFELAETNDGNLEITWGN